MVKGKIMKIVYGPVPSWRFGRSLGLDPICSEKKICSFDCVYCQLGRTKIKTLQRKPYIDVSKLKSELESTEKKNIDVITFSGTGEPTLNSELGDMIDFAKGFGFPVVILTSSSLLSDAEVRDALGRADVVAAKLDAPNDEIFQKINRPIQGLHFETILNGIKKFREGFKGKLALQMMFIEHNKAHAEEIAELAKEIGPDEVQIDTPLRRSTISPLSPAEIGKIEKFFTDLPVISVYKKKRPKTVPIDLHETLIRRPE